MTFPEFPGHFDGDPLVPGAALLEWVAREAGLARFTRVRFVAPVRPGEAVALELARDGDRVRFTIRGEDGLRARGEGHASAT
ncbi:MAG: hydroxymyristoyl-ACP dehydratase [Myxococcota bacterium]